MEGVFRDALKINGENITGIKPYEQIIKINGEYKNLKILPPELRLFADGIEFAPNDTITYSEGMTIRALLSNYYPDLENNATWNIAEPREIEGETKYSTSNWRNIYNDGDHLISYDAQEHTAIIEFTLSNAPSENLSGVLYWHITNGNEIYFKNNLFTLSLKEPEAKYDDANCDGNIKLNDAVLIMQALANPDKFGVNGSDPMHITKLGWANADCSGNGDGVSGKDALAIQKLILQLIDSLSEE